MTSEIGQSSGDHGSVLALQLASIAYDLCDGKLKPLFPAGWSPVWTPTSAIEGNYAYIAYNGSNQYVVAIRGSIIDFSWGSFDDWFREDLNVLIQEDWNYPNSSDKPKISKGSSEGLTNLTKLQNSAGQTMLAYLVANAIPSGASIGVVGHSLGANLATVYAPWLHFQLAQQRLTVPSLFPVMTYAAPTAGNGPFAKAFDQLFPNSWRYYNEADIVPKASKVSQIASMSLLYSPKPEANSISVEYDGYTVTLAEAIVALAGVVEVADLANDFSYYSHTNVDRGSVALNTDLKLRPTCNKDGGIIEWFEQAGAQHDHNYYLSLLQQSIGPGAA
jgi:hypothetical protein